MKRAGCVASVLFFVAIGGCEVACLDNRVEDESRSIVVVHNCGAGLWTAETRWTVREELRIGALEGESAFGAIRALAADSSGRIFVADGRPERVEVFTSDGRHSGTIGGAGQGPGEFSRIAGLGIDSLDRLWVVDFGNRRYTVFDLTGVLIFTREYASSIRWIPWPGQLAGDRLVEVDGSSLGEGQELVFLDTDLRVLERVPFPLPEPGSVPFDPEPIFALSPSGASWSGSTGVFQLALRDPKGDTVVAMDHEILAEQLTISERQDALARTTEVRQQVAALAGVPDDGENEIPLSRIPQTRPLLGVLWIDDLGHLWVGLDRVQGGEGRDYDIFNESGSYLGRLGLPFAVQPSARPVFRENRMYAVTRDELGREFVVIAHVERPDNATAEAIR